MIQDLVNLSRNRQQQLFRVRTIPGEQIFTDIVNQRAQLQHNLSSVGHTINPFKEQEVKRAHSCMDMVCMENVSQYNQILELEEMKRNMAKEEVLMR